MAKLSVIVPVYNEGPHLGDFLHYLLTSDCPLEREWIFVDDGSKDGSVEILKSYSKKYPLVIVEQGSNQGKGAAIMAGIQKSTGQFIMIQDADFEYDVRDVPGLLIPLIENRADVVYGSRFKKSAPQVHRTYHYFVNRFLTVMNNLLSGVYLTDMETCYKIFRADLLKAMSLQTHRFGFEVEVTAYLAKTSARIFELPIHYYPRTRLQGKKINWKDGVAALWHIVRFNLFVNEADAFKNLPGQYQPNRDRSLESREPYKS